MMKDLAKRLVSAYRRHGPVSFIVHAFKNTRHFALNIGRATQRKRSSFDQALGIETDLIREIGSLDICSNKSARYAVRYEPSPVDVVRRVLSELPVDHARYAFVDFGAGKGRVLILASEFPFTTVTGIEFSRELVDVAEQNIRRVPDGMKKALDIRCIHGDMGAFEIPHVPLVCYFYNPCSAEVLGTVIDNLEMSWAREPRDILAIYVDPRHRPLFEASGRWNKTTENKLYTIYRLSPNLGT